MRRFLLATCAMLALMIGWSGTEWSGGQELMIPTKGAGHDMPDKKFPDFDKLVKGAKEYEGLFKLYHLEKEDRLFAELKPHQLNRPFLCPIAIARGMGMGGHTLNFDEQWVLLFKRASETKLHLIRRNVHFQARPGSPVAKAVETTYTDSVLMAIPIRSIHPGRQGILIDMGDMFMTDFADLGLGGLDRSRSTWGKIKAFPRNVEIQVAATFGGSRWGRDESVIDPRGNTVVVHYGLVELPEYGYQSRFADDRVGYFLSVVKDFSSDSKDTSFLRHVNRWRLERADTDPKNKNKLSVPKKKIVFWIEKSVPYEYRPYVRDGILEWNKAFEKIGFRDAIEVRQQESEDFEPEDVNYNTFRWIANGRGYAMGPSRANPLTGEIIDADIVFDADMVRYWKQEAKLFGSGKFSLEETPSTIMAIRQGWGLPSPSGTLSWDTRTQARRAGEGDPQARRASEGPEAEGGPASRLWAIRQGLCQCGPCVRYELGLASLALAARGEGAKGGEGVPEELIGQAIKMVVMHEVGHTLGLRHNFKASTMLKNEQLHDTSITRKLGLSGSVMDYLPVNLAPKGVKQGDYFTTTIGPYDYWAIEYAYKPLDGGTDGELSKLQEIANRGAKMGHDYATDEDMYGTADPLINAWDLGADPMKFAMERMLLAEELMKTLHEKVVDKGEGYQRVRQAFGMLMRQYGDGAYLVSSFVGGEHIHRDHSGDPSARDPFVPVKAAKQRKALEFLQEHILNDHYFKFPPQLLRRLAADRWSHWGNSRSFSVDYPLHDRILAIQRIVLSQLLDAGVLSRIQNNALKTDNGEQPLTVAEVFRSLTDGIWGEHPVKGAADVKRQVKSTVIRRNLQREHLKEMSNLVLGERQGGGGFMIFFGRSSGRVPPDARSLARAHLREIQGRIVVALNEKNAVDETTRAHLDECRERIGRVLSASLQINEP